MQPIIKLTESRYNQIVKVIEDCYDWQEGRHEVIITYEEDSFCIDFQVERILELSAETQEEWGPSQEVTRQTNFVFDFTLFDEDGIEMSKTDINLSLERLNKLL